VAEMKKIKIVSILFLLFIVNSVSVGATLVVAHNKMDKLNELNKAIKNLKNNISTNQHQQTNLQQQLRKNEIAAGDLAIKLKRTRDNLGWTKVLIKKLDAGKMKYQQKLKIQQDDLAEQIRATYMLGKETYLKLLLDNRDPSQVSRIFVYYNYLQKRRLELINEIEQTLRHLHNNKQQIEKETRRFLILEKQQKNELQNLNAHKKQRTHLLHKINQKINTQQQKLNKLLADKKNLEKIIARLRTEVSPDFATPLNRLHKKLSWPTKGKINDLYGSRILHSQLKWGGILIRAPLGQNVRAISSGKIVFADWLSGYGLLVIINHGHGYMSLYARNNSLYKHVGDIVQKGEVIASVGKSGGYKTPSLYFAIRHNGKPVNPKLWCC
jgi:septal ring factor EnvC (AmiA/AmiB activator)